MNKTALSKEEQDVLSVALDAVREKGKRDAQFIWKSLGKHFGSALPNYADITHSILSSAVPTPDTPPVKLAFRIQSAQILHGDNVITVDHIYNPHTLPDNFEDTMGMALRVFSKATPKTKPNSPEYWGGFTKFINNMNGNFKFESARVPKEAYARLLSCRMKASGAITPVIADAREMDLSRLSAERTALFACKAAAEDEKRASRQNLRTGKPSYPYHGRGGPKDPDLL